MICLEHEYKLPFIKRIRGKTHVQMQHVLYTVPIDAQGARLQVSVTRVSYLSHDMAQAHLHRFQQAYRNA